MSDPGWDDASRTEPGIGPDKKDLILALVAAGAGLLFHLFYFNHGVHNLIDLALQAVDGSRILDGEIYGVDFHAAYGPARYYIIALFFALFGESVFVLSCLFLLVMAVNNGLLYFLSRYLMPRSWAFFAVSLGVVAHGSIHKGFFILSALLVLLALFIFLKGAGKRGTFRLGLILILVFFLRWDVGVIGLGAAALLFALMLFLRAFEPDVKPLRTLAVAASGYLMFALPAAFAFFFLLDPAEFITRERFWIRAFDVSHKEYSTWTDFLADSGMKARLFLILAAVLFFAMIGCGVWAVKGFIRRRNKREVLMLAALVLLGLPLFNQVHILIRFNRLLQVAPLFYMALAFLLYKVLAGSTASRGFAARLTGGVAAYGTGAVFFGMLLIYIWSYMGFASQDSFAVLRYRDEERYIDHPRARCYMKKGIGQDLEKALSFIEARIGPDELFYAGPTCPLLYFIVGRPNPTPYTAFNYYYHNPEAEDRIIELLIARNVRLYVDWPRSVATCSFEEACPSLTAYLKLCFEPLRGPAGNRRFVFREKKDE